MRVLVAIAVFALSACAVPGSASDAPPYSDVDPAGFVRFETDAEANRRRELLIDTIWPDGMPADAARVDVDPGATGYAIVHDGHRPKGKIITDLKPTIDALERLGYQTFFLTMPEPTDDHGLLFEEYGTAAMQLFLDPVIEVVNAVEPHSKPIVMTGLSGGGWATHLAAAVDPRIDLSIPVAGSLPLYLRPFSPGSEGDAEQWWPEIFGEVDTDDDGIADTASGVASWLEVYALAVTGGRTQIQVLNLDDPCCFSGDAHTAYSGWLAETFNGWSIIVDDTHDTHAISEHVIDAVIVPAVHGVNPA